ncbi:hypothetical protein [Sphingobacterium multivorum]|uniref:hypothetical protein n=1 Tax=Sphingobacterium multivorum TaxID=28454 RepID=UPI003DA38BC4
MALKHRFILIGLILLKFIIQYQLISPIYELQRDEFLHLDQANHLAWGYLSVPPLTSWTSYLIKKAEIPNSGSNFSPHCTEP